MRKILITYIPASLFLVFLAMGFFTFGGCGGDGGGGSTAGLSTDGPSSISDYDTDAYTASWPVAPKTVVTGADDPDIDVPAVQSAVDQGGMVILRGTFDFGTDAGNHIIVPGRPFPDQDEKGKSTVFIYQKDVMIVGETGPQGELLTVVKNGMPPFWIGWDGEVSREPPPGTYGVDYGIESFPVDASGRVDYRDTGPEQDYEGPQTRYARAYQTVRAAIKNIFFDSPKHYGVKATAGRDVVVLGNVFRKVEFGGLVYLNSFAGATRLAVGFGGAGLFYAPFVYPAITGKIVAERNVVDDVGTEEGLDLHLGESYGMAALFTNAAVRIERNEIRNVGRQEDGTESGAYAASILLGDNYGASPVVSQNIIYNSSLIGIWDLVGVAPSPGPTIRHNTLDDCVIGIMTDSWIGPRTGVLIHQNSISYSQGGLLGSGQACIVASQSKEALIRANRFEGDYAGPLVTLSSSSDCTLLENRDLRSAMPTESPTYFLDGSSSGNLIRGGSGTAIDLGTNNEIYLQGPGQ
jgi:hypothetical protein